MRGPVTLRTVFVRTVPEKLEERTLYVSMEFATVVHKCCCGCGHEVVTPLSPTDWKLTYDGVGVSLHPSIGNWSLRCQSHYWIAGNTARWAGRWTAEEIAAGRQRDRFAKAQQYGAAISDARKPVADRPAGPFSLFWRSLKAWWTSPVHRD